MNQKSPAMWSIVVGLGLAATADAGSWPQFRGLNSSGRAESADKLPTQIGPDASVVWKTTLPPGHSSPAILGDRIYLSAVRDGKLVTIALDRANGKTIWEVEAPYDKLEEIHRIGSHAQATPATDGERVVSFFGSSGLYCYDAAGKLLWRLPMGPFNNDFGAASSPIIVEDRVILCQDHDSESFLIAVDKRTGKTIWETDRSEFPRNFCTPVIWEVEGKKQIVIAATLRVVGYDFNTGKELWTVRGLSRTVCMTPVVADDGTLIAAGWSAGGDASDQIRLDPFDDTAKLQDKNKDGLLAETELADGAVKQRFSQIDRDNTGTITRAEYEYFRGLFDKGRNVVLAIRAGGRGDVSDSHVLWQHNRFVPFCASPLWYEGKVFTIKDGGIFTCLDAKSGKPYKQGRLDAAGEYYSSPVAGDGKVYWLSEEGKLTVTRADETCEVLATADFAEDAYATPALVDGRIYLRTAKHLYCFGASAGD